MQLLCNLISNKTRLRLILGAMNLKQNKNKCCLDKISEKFMFLIMLKLFSVLIHCLLHDNLNNNFNLMISQATKIKIKISN